MKKILFVFVLFFFGGAYLLALALSGGSFASYLSQDTALQVDDIPHRQLSLGQDVQLELTGDGFTSETQVSSYMDTINDDAVVANLPLDGVIYDLLLLGDKLFVANGSAGLQIFDIHDPLKPKHLQTIRLSTVLDITLADDKLVLCCGNLGVKIYPLRSHDSLPHDFKSLFSFSVALASVYRDGYLYVASGDEGLAVYDLRDPEIKTPLWTVGLQGFTKGIAIYENYLYLINIHGGPGFGDDKADGSSINVVELNETGPPALVGRLEFETGLKSILVDSDILYATDNTGLTRYSLEDPAHPEPLGEKLSLNSPRGVFKFGQRLYVSDAHTTMNAFTVAADNKLSLLGSLVTSGSTRAVVKRDHYLYLAIGNFGLKIVEEQKLRPMQLLASIHSHGPVNDLMLKGRWLYLAGIHNKGILLQDLQQSNQKERELFSGTTWGFAEQGGLLIAFRDRQSSLVIDTSNPGQPVLLAELPDSVDSAPGAFVNSLLAVPNGNKIYLYDLSDPRQPRIVDQMSGIHSRRLTADKDLLFCIAQKEISICRVLADGRLERVSVFRNLFPMQTFADMFDVKKKGDLLYVADGRSGLLLVDIKDLHNPRLLSLVALPGFTTSLQLNGNRMFAFSRYGGVSLFDLSVPEQPRKIANIPLMTKLGKVEFEKKLFYMTQGLFGVWALPIPQLASQVETLAPQRLRVRMPSPKYPGRYSLEVSNRQGAVTLNGVLEYR